MGNVSPNDHLYAQCIGQADCEPPLIPQSLIDLMPSANEYIARLESLARDFMPPNPELTCTTLSWWIARVVAHLRNCDVHAAPTAVQ